jgi:hypothetical protein
VTAASERQVDSVPFEVPKLIETEYEPVNKNLQRRKKKAVGYKYLILSDRELQILPMKTNVTLCYIVMKV